MREREKERDKERKSEHEREGISLYYSCPTMRPESLLSLICFLFLFGLSPSTQSHTLSVGSLAIFIHHCIYPPYCVVEVSALPLPLI
jgi:hypothetical protein